MSAKFSKTKFLNQLKLLLPKSTGEHRRVWATTIVEKDIDIKYLAELLKCEQKVVTRFLWLLSDVGLLNPDKLLIELPFLFNIRHHISHELQTSFASLWLIAGVPLQNEGKAIDLLFQWLLSGETNVTIKSRSFLVLFKLTQKYPELKNELKLSLLDQMDKYSKDFKKRAVKILIKIDEGVT